MDFNSLKAAVGIVAADSLDSGLNLDSLPAVGPRVEAALGSSNADTLRAFIESNLHKSGYCYLPGAFDACDDAVEVPSHFLPVPNTPSTIAARATAVALHYLIELETVSYQSENDGALFVNLVPMSSAGRIAEKSVKAMRGHTDAVSFPTPPDLDFNFPRISPSPCVVTLCALKNPLGVPTVVMPLDRILATLNENDIAELSRPHYFAQCQSTFRSGTKRALGDVHVADCVSILSKLQASPERATSLGIRFSHSTVLPMADAPESAARARAHLVQACAGARENICLSSGDILIIDNRRALHGRASIEITEPNNLRWLLRAYGLDSRYLLDHQRMTRRGYMLFP